MSLSNEINGRYPVPSQLPAKLRRRNAEAAKVAGEDVPELEAALHSYISERYEDARAKTMWHRSTANEFLQRRYAEIPSDDDTDIANYVLPLVGQKGHRLLELILSELIPDPEENDFFTVSPKAGPGMNADAMRGAFMLELWLRDALREGGFYEAVQSFLDFWGYTGNAVAFWEWHQEFTEEDVDPLAEDYVPGGKRVRLVRQYPTLEVPDQRNTMPCSLQSAKGMQGCEYVAFYTVRRYRDLIDNEVRDGGSGKIGAYANVARFTPESEVEVSTICDDVFVGPRGQNGYADWRMMWWDYGLEVHQYVGALHWEKIKLGGGKSADSQQVDSLLRKFGNDPSKCRDKRWWLIEICNGSVIRCQPYPYHRGERCPFVHARMFRDEGFTYGRSIYDYNANTEEMWNYMFHLLLDIAEGIARPWIGLDESAVDAKWAQSKNWQVANIPPRGVVKVNSGSSIQQAIQEFRPPHEALTSTASVMDMLEGMSSRFTAVTPAVEGAGAVNETATGSLQQQNFSMIPVRSQVTRLSPTLAEMITMLIDVAREYGTGEMGVFVQNPSDIDRLSWYDPEVTAMVEEINAGKAMELAGVLSTFTTDDFFGDFSVRVFGPASGGGKAAKLAALKELMTIGSSIEATNPGLVNFHEFMRRFARIANIADADGLFNDPMQQQEAVQWNAGLMAEQGAAQAAFGGMGASGAPGGGKGRPSPPAPRGNSTDAAQVTAL